MSVDGDLVKKVPVFFIDLSHFAFSAHEHFVVTGHAHLVFVGHAYLVVEFARIPAVCRILLAFDPCDVSYQRDGRDSRDS